MEQINIDNDLNNFFQHFTKGDVLDPKETLTEINSHIKTLLQFDFDYFAKKNNPTGNKVATTIINTIDNNPKYVQDFIAHRHIGLETNDTKEFTENYAKKVDTTQKRLGTNEKITSNERYLVHIAEKIREELEKNITFSEQEQKDVEFHLFKRLRWVVHAKVMEKAGFA